MIRKYGQKNLKKYSFKEFLKKKKFFYQRIEYMTKVKSSLAQVFSVTVTCVQNGVQVTTLLKT